MKYLYLVICLFIFSPLLSMDGDSALSNYAFDPDSDDLYSYMKKIWSDESESDFKEGVRDWVVSLNEHEYKDLMRSLLILKNQYEVSLTAPLKKFDEDETACSICATEWKELQYPQLKHTLTCGHSLCTQCEFQWADTSNFKYQQRIFHEGQEIEYTQKIELQNSNKCPTCQTDFVKNDFLYYQLESLYGFFRSIRPYTPPQFMVSRLHLAAGSAIVALGIYGIYRWYAAKKNGKIIDNPSKKKRS